MTDCDAIVIGRGEISFDTVSGRFIMILIR